MNSSRNRRRDPQVVRAGVLCLHGYGLRLAVERGHLIAEDGVADEQRAGRFARVGSGIQRVIVLGHSGTVSLEALRWLHEIDAAFVQIGAAGELIATGAPHAITDVRLRRAQAIVGASPAGLAIARRLLVDKVAGQARVLDDLGGYRDARRAVNDAVSQLEACTTLDDLRFVESRAAAAYWSAWEDVAIHFAGRESRHVPAHWKTFGTRRSLLTSGARKATNPANALLNYLYTIVLAEARLAALAVGCDPALGVIHVDKGGRDSLACDLMEPVRPVIDAHVLRLLETHTFERSDFFETREGNCRLMPEIAAPLATTALRWRSALGPIAEDVGAAFQHAPTRVVTSDAGSRGYTLRPFRTPLTGRNRSRPLTPRAAATAVVHFQRRCRTCGADLKNAKRMYCGDCLPSATKRAAAKAVETAKQLHSIGADGRQSEHARALHRTHANERARERREWESRQATLPSGHEFDERIRPLLADVPDPVLAKATGLSLAAIKSVRAGRMRPHPRHWGPLRVAAQAHSDANPPNPILRDPKFFARVIAPRLLGLGAEGIRKATGLSKSYSRRVLHGHHVPDRKHWTKLAEAIGVVPRSDAIES